MPVKAISEFPQANNVNNLDLVLISQEDSGNYISKYAESSALRSIGAYTFVCGIDQNGTNAPNLTDNFNNYGSAPSANYVGVGTYEITNFDNLLSVTSTHIEINLNALDNVDYQIRTSVTDDNTIQILTSDSGALSDDVMNVNGLYLKVTTYI
jgi:hypothetical protein